MITLTSIVPLIIGGCAGMLYGCSFVLQQRGLFFATEYPAQRAQQIGFFLARITILFFAGRYLLRSALIPSILGSITFFCLFWLVILVVKAQVNERV